MLRVCLVLILIFSLSFTGKVFAEGNDTYIISLSYKDFDQIEDFAVLIDQIEFFERKKTKIIALSDYEEFLKNNSSDKAVILNFEKANPVSVKAIAPYLLEKNIPFSVFVSLNDWKDAEDLAFLHELSKNSLVNIGLHTIYYEIITDIKDFRHELNRSIDIYKEVIGAAPKYFSFSKGLYTKEMLQTLGGYSFDVVLGQNNGIITLYNYHDVWPQFEITPYKNFTIQGFDIILQTKPLHIEDITPAYSLIDTATPSLGFTIAGSQKEFIDEIKCFTDRGGLSEGIFILNNRIEIRPKLEENRPYEISCLIRDGVDQNDASIWRRHGFLLYYAPDLNTLSEE